MTKVEINAGACGMVTTVRAAKQGARQVSLEISSDCPAVAELAADLTELGFDELLRHRFAQGPLAELAGRTLKHAACPVISGVLKAAEVELGLNVPRPATITFVEED